MYPQNASDSTEFIGFLDLRLLISDLMLQFLSYSKDCSTTSGFPPVAQQVKNLPAMQGTQVLSLGQGDPLEEEMAAHSSVHAWEISWAEAPSGLQSVGLQRVRYDLVTEHEHMHKK